MVRYNDLTNSSVNYGRDVRQRIINVDAEYRETPIVYIPGTNKLLSGQNTPTDFLFRLTTPVRNVGGFKVTSIEMNNVSFGSNLYSLLQVNDESSIESRAAGGREIRAVAKIPNLTSGGNVLLSDSTGLITNNVVFRNPQDVTVLRVRLVNPSGSTIVSDVSDSRGGVTVSEYYLPKVSFTLELDEVTNSYLYESQRQHVGYDPANALK